MRFRMSRPVALPLALLTFLLLAYFVGQVMKESKGKANPALVGEILERKLKG